MCIFLKPKGALDKHNSIFLCPKLNQHQNFQLTLPMRFHFMWVVVNNIPRLPRSRCEMCMY